MDYSMLIIFGLVILFFLSQVHWTYFKKGPKLSDEDLMQNFLDFKMKKSHPRYFPSMKINEKS